MVLSDRTRERAVERMRADFVANASHELRTPLASLIGFIDTLQGPAADDPPAQQRFLGIMAEQAARMNRLIDDLLSLSRIELTEHQPPAERVDLARAGRRVVAGFEPAAGGARGDAGPGGGRPACRAVPADADQIAQVLQNLIDNAVKYGREGGHVQVRLTPAPPGGRWPARPGVVLTVARRRAGHSARPGAAADRAVLPGRQGPLAAAPGAPDLVLPSSSTSSTATAASLLIESEEGQGARFSIWLPVGDKAETK